MSDTTDNAEAVNLYGTVPPAPKGTDRKVRIAHLQEMKRTGRCIVMATAYDACFARFLDQANVDVILVGDSVGMVVHGFENTLPVTMDMMITHCQAVRRGSLRSFLVGDMPFMSYQVSIEEAVRNAGRLIQEGNVEAVKLEGASPRVLPVIEAIVGAGIPVMGHLGLTPQSVHQLSGFRVQGRSDAVAEHLVELARAQEAAGAFSLVLEAVPRLLAKRITETVSIPTIGIGAGAECDGQVLVLHDVLGLSEHPPKFTRAYANVGEATLRAFRKWGRDVRERSFPGDAESYD